MRSQYPKPRNEAESIALKNRRFFELHAWDFYDSRMQSHQFVSFKGGL